MRRTPFTDSFALLIVLTTFLLILPQVVTAQEADTTSVDPIVSAVQETEPSTPEQIVRAIEIMMDLNESKEAKRYIRVLLESNPSTDQLAGLQQKFGLSLFVRMSQDKLLEPEGLQLADAILQASQRVASDPERLRRLIDQLVDPVAETRAVAALDLRESGQAAVTAMVESLQDSGKASVHHAIQQTLVSMGPGFVERLIGVLESPDAELRTKIIEVLGALGSQPAAAYLAHPSIVHGDDSSEGNAARRALARILGGPWKRDRTERLLEDAVRGYLDGIEPSSSDAQGTIRLWYWNVHLNRSAPQRFRADVASAVAAARLARDLYRISPANREYHLLLMLAHLKAAKLVTGLDAPLPEDANQWAQQRGPEMVQTVLEQAMSSGHLGAAIAAAEVLAALKQPRSLDSAGGHPSPLARALRHPDRRLRFAAAAAVIQINPTGPYAGSSYLTEALGYFIRTSNTRRALIGLPHAEQARRMVGLLNQMGLEADTASTGNELVQRAIDSSDYEFILISDRIGHPDVHALIQILRADPRTANLPVSLMVRTERGAELRRRTIKDDLTDVFGQPFTAESTRRSISRLARLAGNRHVPSAIRQRQAISSLAWFSDLAADNKKYGYYDLHSLQDQFESALYVPGLTLGATRVLGFLGSPVAQHALVQIASQQHINLDERQAAVQAFETAVKRHGLLLTTIQILRQYERYNNSRDSKETTQEVLGAVLDVIESATQSGAKRA